ncbi:MAG: ATP-dependent helicase HrpA [Gammaproteobacteria bacterium]|jgi:ATP-dependent helicase HrpA|nr:ATP-dependent helicase HrpA [Gammaproteobacteria bacterium]
MTRQIFSHPIHFPSELPITAHLEEIRQALKKHQVIVVAGETGSGKTTQLPKLMLELGRGVGKLIGHTQPRRIAARSVAERIAEELKTSLGDIVGYQVRFHHQANENTYIKVMTDGILLAELSQDRLLKRYDTLIIDEAHERSLNIDFILGYLKWLLPKRPDLKIIITSATLDHQRFSSHFNHCPVVEVSGRGYPVEIRYQPLNENVEASEASQAHEILRAVQSLPTDGDILVFLSGERDIRQANDFLRKSGLRHTEILPLFSKLSAADQQKIFHPSGLRRIILATNVAETSLTIPNIKYVIDTGLARIKRYSYRSKIQRLPIEAISKASAKQRAGRCGRTSPGICIRLCSEQEFILREDYTEPEILRSNLANVILQMLALNLGDPEKFPWLDAPESQFWKDAYQCLEELRAITLGHHQWQLTEAGRALAKLPLDPRLGKMLLTAQQKNCLEDVLIIVSALSIADILQRPMDKRQAADEAHKQFFDPRSDFLTYLNLWYALHEIQHHQSNKKLRQFCEENFLSYLKFREWQDMYHELRAACLPNRMQDHVAQQSKKTSVASPAALNNSVRNDNEIIPLHQSILSGILSHVAMKDVDGQYLATRNRYIKIFPGSALYKKQPPWIMAMEVMETQQVYARTVAGVESQWIEGLAPHLIKKTYSDPHWDARRGEVLASERVLFFGLPIIQKRRVRYASIDPELSHEIFVREALAQRQLNALVKFWQKNEKFLTELEQLEERTRSRHFVPDEDWLYAFYLNKIPREICNRVDLEKWAKANTTGFLEITEKDLENEQLKNSLNAYPSSLDWQGNQLKLSYQFSPGSAEDGVSLELPLALLAVLPEEAFDWLVPGFLEQKVLAILKALPKELRKALMPMADAASVLTKYAMQLLEANAGETQQGCQWSPLTNPLNFFAALSQLLAEEFGVSITQEALRSLPLPDFLLFNFKLIDDGKVLAMSRDLLALKKDFLSQKNTASIEDEVIYQEWPNQNLPESIQVKHQNLSLTKYLALHAEDEGVGIVSVDLLETAKSMHRMGVAELLRLRCHDTFDYVIKKILVPAVVSYDAQLMKGEKFRDSRIKSIQVVWAKVEPVLGVWDTFIRQFSYALIFMTFPEDFWLIRDEEAFEEAYQHNHRDLVENANVLVPTMQNMIGLLLKLYLKGKSLNGFATLFVPGFLVEVPWEWLERYPAYLAAITNGLDELASDKQRSIAKLEKLHQQTGAGWDKARFLIEEYRASLYLPAFRPIETVSEARLLKMLA